MEGVTDLWTDIFMYTTPYMSLVGKFLKPSYMEHWTI